MEICNTAKKGLFTGVFSHDHLSEKENVSINKKRITSGGLDTDSCRHLKSYNLRYGVANTGSINLVWLKVTNIKQSQFVLLTIIVICV